MPRKPKTWRTEDEILKAIDRANRLAARKAKLGEDEDAKAKQLAKEAQEFEDKKNFHQASLRREQSGSAREKASNAWKLYKRAIEKTVPRLGRILAAYRTETIPSMVGDYKGVVVR